MLVTLVEGRREARICRKDGRGGSRREDVKGCEEDINENQMGPDGWLLKKRGVACWNSDKYRFSLHLTTSCSKKTPTLFHCPSAVFKMRQWH
jgi:hypothetical protein